MPATKTWNARCTGKRQPAGTRWKFIMSTGSPITPDTPLARVQRFVELGKQIE